jgi:hypothetical protein
MASSGKRKTTMAKMNRERKLLERRQEKQARKVARKQALADGTPLDEYAADGAADLNDPRPSVSSATD